MTKRILFLTIPEKGHINPMIGPAVWLQRLGHTVRFRSAHDISAQLNEAGLVPLETMAEATPPADVNRGAFFAERVRDNTWLREWIRTLLIDQASAQIEPLARTVAAYSPDVIVTDPMIYPAAIVAHRLGIPWVALSNSLNPVLDEDIRSELLDTVEALRPARDALFRANGMQAHFRGCDILSPHLTIALTTPEFIGREVPGVEMVGPSIPPAARGDETDFPWDRLDDEMPLIYMSFGSQVYHQPHLFNLVAEATDGLGVQVVMSVNELMNTDFVRSLPPHVVPCHYAPQLALLPRVRAFITHGGANSVMEALHYGVPLLLSPLCNDQFHQAHYVGLSGVGRVLDLEKADVEEVRETLRNLLQSEAVAAAMRRVSASYSVNGARRSAELIAELMHQRREEVVAGQA